MATAQARPRRPLPRAEQEVENIVLALLGADASPQGWLWPVVIGAGNLPAKAPPGYRSMLPCPLWGDCWTREAVLGEADDDDAPVTGNDADQPDTRKRRAVRQSDDGSKRDPFILNRFEKILAMAEMVNVDRPSDDSEDEDARKAADDLDEIAIGRRSGKPATRLKFDLDLPPQAIDTTPLDSSRLYPEWDYRRSSYLPDYCRVLTGKAAETGESWTPDAGMLRHVIYVRRRFEALLLWRTGLRPAATTTVFLRYGAVHGCALRRSSRSRSRWALP
jgi:nitric oxide reductase NorD protein